MSRGSLCLIGMTLAAVTAAGCFSGDGMFTGGGTPRTPPTVRAQRAGLRVASGCEDMVDAYRERLREQMRAQVEQSRDQYDYYLDNFETLDSWCGYQNCYGEDCYYAGPREDDADGSSGPRAGAPQSAAASEGSGSSSGSSRSYSETNNQVAGVDEADMLKNDGDYIYLLADGALQIIDAWPADRAHVVSRTAIEGDAKRLFVNAGRALVYSSIAPQANPDDPYGSSRYGYGGDCTYGYDCDFTGDGMNARISVFDLADLAHPELLRTIEFSGSYINSRRIGDDVYTVLSFAARQPNYTTWINLDYCEYADGSKAAFEAAIEDAIERKIDENLALIDAMDLGSIAPSGTDTLYVDGVAEDASQIVDDCGNAYIAESGDAQTILMIAGMQLSSDALMNVTTILGKPGAVYSSFDSLYIASRHQASAYSNWTLTEDGEVDPEATTIHKFRLDAGTTEYLGSGVAKGRILNQFAMDELDGNLRIATTTGHLPSPDAHNTLSVLEPTALGLEVIGMVDDIAPTEDIRSVRFAGETGYIVTFKKTDPLFTLDLSDPRNPRVLGELLIPGFSTYIHPIDDDHLLSIGYDADDQGSFAWFQGIQLQLFDVSDLEHPRLAHKVVIGSRGSASAAATDHLAFNYFASEGWLAVPITVCEGGSGGSYGSNLTFSGLQVYDVDLTAGFELLGGIPHVEAGSAPSEDDYGYGGDCFQWWSGATSAVKRAVFIEDFAYSVATDELRVANIENLGSLVATIDLIAK